MHESVSKRVLDRRFSDSKNFQNGKFQPALACSRKGLLLPVEESYDTRLLVHGIQSLELTTVPLYRYYYQL